MDEHGLPIAFGKQAQISLPPKPQSAPPAASGEGERGPRGIVGGSRKNKGGGGGGVPQGSKQDFNTGDKRPSPTGTNYQGRERGHAGSGPNSINLNASRHAKGHQPKQQRNNRPEGAEMWREDDPNAVFFRASFYEDPWEKLRAKKP